MSICEIRFKNDIKFILFTILTLAVFHAETVCAEDSQYYSTANGILSNIRNRGVKHVRYIVHINHIYNPGNPGSLPPNASINKDCNVEYFSATSLFVASIQLKMASCISFAKSSVDTVL